MLIAATRHGHAGGRADAVGRGQLPGRAVRWRLWFRARRPQRGRPRLAVRLRWRRRRGGATAAAGTRGAAAAAARAAECEGLPNRGSRRASPPLARRAPFFRYHSAVRAGCVSLTRASLVQASVPLLVAFEASALSAVTASQPPARAPPRRSLSPKSDGFAGGAAAAAPGGGKKPRKELCPPGCRVAGCADRTDWLPYNSRACCAADRVAGGSRPHNT